MPGSDRLGHLPVDKSKPLLGTLLGSGPEEPRRRALENELDSARRRYESGDYEDVVEILKEPLSRTELEAASTTPANRRDSRMIGSALVTLGLSYLGLDRGELATERFERAAAWFERAQRERGDRRGTLAPHDEADFGIALEASGHPDEAIERLRGAIADGVDLPEAHRHLARAIMRAGDQGARAEAEGALREAAARLPGDPITLTLLGEFLAEERPSPNGDRRAEAADYLTRAGNALARRGRFADANDRFARATEIDGDHIEGNLGRAEALRVLGDPDSALPYARRAHTLAPEDAHTHLVLSAVLEELGQSAESLAIAEAGLQLEPGWHGLQFSAALGLAVLGRNAEAVERLRAWLSVDPEWEDGVLLITELLCGDARHEEALEVLDEWRQRVPGSANVEGLYGLVLLALEDLEGAETHLRGALELDPTLDWAARQHARVLIELRRGPDALQLLEPLWEQGSGDRELAVLYARALCGDERIDEAISVLAPFVDGDASPELLGWLGELYRLRGGADGVRDGEVVLRRALVLDDANAFAHGTLGALLAEDGRRDEALIHLQHAVALDERYGFAWMWQGIALYELEQLDAAEAALEHAVEIDPALTEAWVRLGVTRQARNLDERALEAFAEVHRLNPDDAEILLAMGQSLRSLGRDQEAVVAFDAALARDAKSAVAYGEKGESLRVLGQYDAAREALEMALELNPGEAWVRASLGATLIGLNRYPEALAKLDAVAAESPDYFFAMFKCGELRTDVADFDGAWSFLRRAEELDSSDAYVHGLLAWVALQRRDGAAALRHAERAAELEPDISRYVVVADALLAMDERERASEKYRETIALAHEHDKELTAWDLTSLGWCFFGLGEYDEAARLLRSAADVDPEPSLRCDLALALLCSGRMALATREYDLAYEAATKLHPWRRYALLLVADGELRQALAEADLALSPAEVNSAKRRMRKELRDAERGRYLPTPG